MKKKNILIIIALILTLVLGCLIVSFIRDNNKHNKELQEYQNKLNDIRSSYNNYININNATIYSLEGNNYIKKGTINNIDTTLEDIDITNYQEEYFKLKNIDYYINYKDITKIDNIEINDRYKNYIVHNENIVIPSNTKIYLKEDSYYQIDSELSLPIIIKDDDKYYVEYDNKLVYVKKEDISDIIESNNTDEEISKGFAVLNYHYTINKEAKEHLQCTQEICLTDTLFDAHMKYLSDNNYFSLTLEEIEMFIDGKIRLPKNSVGITIDDGWYVGRSITILEKYNLHGILFLIGSLAPTSDYQSANLEIASHTWNLHRKWGDFISASKEDAINDLKKSRESLNNTKYFCYPFYQYNDNVISYLKETGFTMAFAGINRKVKVGENKYLVPRYGIINTMTVDDIAKIVK